MDRCNFLGLASRQGTPRTSPQFAAEIGERAWVAPTSSVQYFMASESEYHPAPTAKRLPGTGAVTSGRGLDWVHRCSAAGRRASRRGALYACTELWGVLAQLPRFPSRNSEIVETQDRFSILHRFPWTALASCSGHAARRCRPARPHAARPPATSPAGTPRAPSGRRAPRGVVGDVSGGSRRVFGCHLLCIQCSVSQLSLRNFVGTCIYSAITTPKVEP